MLQKFGLLCIGLILLLCVIIGGSSAQSSPDLSSRVFRLESEAFSLRSQVSQLEFQVNRLSNQLQSMASVPNREEDPPSPPVKKPQLPPDEQFDRLATLLIELKEQVNEIEARLSELESKRF